MNSSVSSFLLLFPEKKNEGRGEGVQYKSKMPLAWQSDQLKGSAAHQHQNRENADMFKCKGLTGGGGGTSD